MLKLSINERARVIAEKMISESADLRINIDKRSRGATVVDVGVGSIGGLEAGLRLTEIALGGLADVSIGTGEYEGRRLPTIHVRTDQPAVALLGSQYAGWRIEYGGFQALASGPARALALKPKHVYRDIDYEDTSSCAVLVLETEATPPDDIISSIASACRVEEENLIMVVVSTASIAGSVQVSGRILETGLHRLVNLGIAASSFVSGHGYAPIAPVHPDQKAAMGRTNDMIIYGGVASFLVESEDEKLGTTVDRAPSCRSKASGRPFSEIFQEAGYNFYGIDPGLFAPAVVQCSNTKTGRTYVSGNVDSGMILRSIS